MLAAIAIPEQLATAKLAGFPPEAGLIAFGCGALAFAAFGLNRYVSVGADSTIAPIFAGAVGAIVASASAGYEALAGAVAIGAGVVLIAAGAARAGWIADLLSVPVTIGFLAGISVHIIAGQLPSLLGIPPPHGALPRQLWEIALTAGNTNPYAAAIGLGVLAVTLGASKLSERIPGALIGLAGAGVAVALLDLRSRGVAVIGALDAHVPPPALPAVGDLDRLFAAIPVMLVVAAVVMMQSSAVVRSFPSEPGVAEDVSGDFTAVGAASVLAGLFGAFAVNASPPRTAVAAESGGRTQAAGLIALALIALIAAFLSGLAAYVPEAALAGVLIFVALRIFRLRDMIRVAEFSRREFNLLIASALLVILLPIQQGMLLAIILSLAHGIFLVMRPASTKLVHVDGSTLWWPPADGVKGEEIPGILVFAPAGPINFTNAGYIRAKLLAAIAAEPSAVRLVIIEASGVTDIDYTGSQSMQAVLEELRSRHIDVAVARLISQHAQVRAEQSGFLAALGRDHLFLTVAEAVQALGAAAEPVLPA